MSPSPATEAAYRDLCELVAIGPRFHGTPQLEEARSLLTRWVASAGGSVRTQEVRTEGWDPGRRATLAVTSPVHREIPSWPMLWSASTEGPLVGEVRAVGVQGIWGDSILWTKFAILSDGLTVGYIHARDVGPAAPQPLPVGSQSDLPHFAIGHIDGLALTEWLNAGHAVSVIVESEASHTAEIVSSNILVDIPAVGGATSGRVLVCGHYDTFWNTPGAYDNGSGTVALAHLVRDLLDSPPNRPVTVVWQTAEEWHLAGSRALAATFTDHDIDAIDMVINIDGLGRGNFLELFAGPEKTEDEALRLIRTHAEESSRVLSIRSRFPPTCGTDHGAYYAVGLPVVFFTFNDLGRLHQPDDLPNYGIAENIAWTVPLVRRLIAELPRGERVPAASLSFPF